MNTPTLSHLQFAVLDCIGGREMKGRDLRQRMKDEKGISKAGPAFYQLMGRMEEGGLVKSKVEDIELGENRLKQKIYWITGEGAKAVHRSKTYYGVHHEVATH
ncbi:MAG: PadR family transcriptional regulator [Verrucomicrobiota bacterium]